MSTAGLGLEMPSVGVVVIGRNEGARLERCLQSLLGLGMTVVYVDSGSTDGSLARATMLGARAVLLGQPPGFTAGRARNLGARALLESEAPPGFIQFVDGDCTVDPHWIPAACAHLAADPGCAVVAGRRRERNLGASIFNRLCDMEWNTPVGNAGAVGGDAMYRTEAFTAVGGFDPQLICGEEPELCLRLSRRGWRITRLDAEMTEHDAAITRWSQWARRTMRGGWAFAEGSAMHGDGPERYGRRQLRSILAWGLAVPTAALICAAVGLILLVADIPGHGALLVLAGTAPAAYVAMALRIAFNRHRRVGDQWRDALLYGSLIMLGKIPEAVGALRYRSARRRGEAPRLIEYKTKADGSADA